MDKTLANRRLGSFLGSGLILFRLAAALAFPYVFLAGARVWALGIYALAVLTDALDGCVGRRWGGRPFLGLYSDAIADFVLVLASFSVFAVKGIYPFWVLLLIVAMFAQFVLTSRRDRPVYDPVGKYYGLFLFAAIGMTLLLAHTAVYIGMQVGMVGFTVASIVSRAVFLLGRGGRENTGGRSIRSLARVAIIARLRSAATRTRIPP
jgi:phosphatidylglycerophosphate synthase